MPFQHNIILIIGHYIKAAHEVNDQDQLYTETYTVNIRIILYQKIQLGQISCGRAFYDRHIQESDPADH